ncbi:hypothetical protein BS329_20930 [Amycolatopsis coloradensis]|uniref:Uncharacterized protein n=1 Tax=Amycolatopsis coloradensis TaxID=76021 RepID=A0A1R0KR23_9PSEU|nr:hypothetical protein BS329_20930 [Amycolatopsis coloradensis]
MAARLQTAHDGHLRRLAGPLYQATDELAECTDEISRSADHLARVRVARRAILVHHPRAAPTPGITTGSTDCTIDFHAAHD